MNDDKDPLRHARAATLAIRAGHQRTPEGEHSEPLFNTSSYVFNSAAEAAARFAGEQPGNVYSRYTNPTVRIFEERMAAIEQAEQAVATSSGMASILAVCMALLQAGDRIVCSSAVFGSTIVMLERYFAKMGVDVCLVNPTKPESWRDAITATTRLVLLETPSNPLNEVVDIALVADLAHAQDALLVVDNTFCTPALQRPLELGADIVTYAATKFLDGQGRCLGGAVAGSSELMQQVLGFVRAAGPTMAPFNAWVFLKGLETLPLRMQAHCSNAQQLAEWLQQQDGVDRVFYGGLAEHPNHALAARQQSGFGAVLSFELAASGTVDAQRAKAWRFIDSVRLLSHTANLGDMKTTIVHPATTTHGRLSSQQRADSGISENLIRIAVGLEDIEDIKDDLLQAFAAVSE